MGSPRLHSSSVIQVSALHSGLRFIIEKEYKQRQQREKAYRQGLEEVKSELPEFSPSAVTRGVLSPPAWNCDNTRECHLPGELIRDAEIRVFTGDEHVDILCLANTKIPPHPQKESNCSA